MAGDVAVDEPNPTPESLAYTLVEHASEVSDEPQKYLTRVVAELFGIQPGVLGHVVDKWFVDLTEELTRRGQEDAVRAVLEVQARWEQEV